jgi:hypothetical protein
MKPLVERWLYLGKHGGWAAAIDGTGALARLLWASPPAARGELAGGAHLAALTALTFHKSRLVRINVALALSSLAGDDTAAKSMIGMLQQDGSERVRVAAAQGLARVAAGAKKDTAAKIKDALDRALREDSAPSVQAAAKAALAGPGPAMPARTEWRTFQVVDASADDAPVRQEPYFVHGPDGVVWASYTDARGEISSEHVAPGTDNDHVHPASRESEY